MTRLSRRRKDLCVVPFSLRGAKGRRKKSPHVLVEYREAVVSFRHASASVYAYLAPVESFLLKSLLPVK